MQLRNVTTRRPLPTILWALAFAVSLSLPSIGRSAEPTPSSVVEVFHASLLAVMKQAEQLPVAERYRRLEAPVKAAFDLPLMIRIASTGHWQGASEDQQRRLVAAFERMSVSNYAHRFDGYSGESFETLRQIPTPRGLVLVETQIVIPEEAPVPLTYVVKSVGESFRIVDVLLSRSVSELAVRRSEYQSVLRREGVDGLVTVLEQKADELISGPKEE